MRDRLIKLTKRAQNEWLEKEYEHETHKDLAEYVADYLLSNGVIVLPCKVGDTLYEITVSGKIIPFIVRSFYQIARWMEYGIFGFFLFTTREEAEKALAERSENEHRKRD